MKKNVLFLLFIVNLFFLQAETFQKIDMKNFKLEDKWYDIDLGVSVDHSIRFKDNTMFFIDYEKGKKFENYIIGSYKYSERKDGGLTFLDLENGTTYLCIASDDVLLLYSKDKKEPEYFGYYNLRIYEAMCFPDESNYQATSYLKENNKEYPAENIGTWNLETPWVENVKGNGIGQKITFGIDSTVIYLMTGYVSYEKPYLYKENSRPKKIKLSFLDVSKESMIIELEDTPAPQKITLGERIESNVELEILEVYEGTKYKDTCINSMFFLY
ncbi:hypothetical protein DYE49_11940 [Treponema rectale]|uniref:NAD glycohydrolase translocation F5/8 type C domain-containing protein n=1 Tax=Treponema rectale TaxID=744512 RepID=A0A840S8J9_9SPIR|nr:hypothetical protein [Treponema rectale]MBB5218969.1 hypothetical protein [Treponema rectale]QOS41119.1 hypothetical protein DYE49_11940 [Treponema rectale]